MHSCLASCSVVRTADSRQGTTHKKSAMTKMGGGRYRLISRPLFIGSARQTATVEIPALNGTLASARSRQPTGSSGRRHTGRLGFKSMSSPGPGFPSHVDTRLVPSQRLRGLAGPVGCRCPGCSVRRYAAWLRSAESCPPPCSGRLMNQAAGWRGASMSIHVYQHRRSLARRSSGTMAHLSARLQVRPVVRLVVARSMVRLVARPVYLRRSPAAPGP